MNNQIHSLSNQLFNIKHKITDLEYYNLMETLTLFVNSRNAVAGALEYVLPPLSSSEETSSSHIEESSIGSVSSCCSQESYNCCC